MYYLLTVVTHGIAFVAGAYAWPHLSTLWQSWSASRVVKDAEALIAKAEADAAALAKARQTVAAQAAKAATVVTGIVGVTGPTGP